MKRSLAGRRNLRRYEGDDTIRTPSAIYRQLDAEFHFTLDAAADRDNALAGTFFDGTVGRDGLLEPWSGRVWCNPPYSDIAPWTAKAFVEVDRGRAEVAVLLLPVRTDLAWFHNHCLTGLAEVRFIRGRLQFENTPKRGTAPHPSMVVIFRRPKED